MGKNKKLRKVNRIQLLLITVFVIALSVFLIHWQNSRAEAALLKVRFENSSGDLSPEFKLEIASTQSQRKKGLMFRKDLPPDRGMIFLFPETKPHSFWMKDTYISLDILFLDSSFKVVGILKEVPILNEKKRGISEPSLYVVELPAGSVEKYGLQKGFELKFNQPVPKGS